MGKDGNGKDGGNVTLWAHFERRRGVGVLGMVGEGEIQTSNMRVEKRVGKEGKGKRAEGKERYSVHGGHAEDVSHPLRSTTAASAAFPRYTYH